MSSGGPGFIAGGFYRSTAGSPGESLWTSRDGVGWRRVAFFRTGAPDWIVRTTAGYAAVGSGSLLYVSTNGIAWSHTAASVIPDTGSGGHWQATGAAARGRVVVMVGSYQDPGDATSALEAGGIVWTAPDIEQVAGPTSR